MECEMCYIEVFWNLVEGEVMFMPFDCVFIWVIKGGRMGRSDKVSLWCVSLLVNTRFRFFILE